MSLYQRYAATEFNKGGNRDDGATNNQNDIITLSPLFGHLASELASYNNTIRDWLSLFPQAAFFSGYDDALRSPVVTLVYENTKTKKINTVSITKYLISYYEDLLLDSRSRFWPACENLLPQNKSSNVRRALAISNLRNYSVILHNIKKHDLTLNFDETSAGSLANQMELLDQKLPTDLGKMLLEMGLLQNHSISSLLLDVVYVNSDSPTFENTNTLIYHIGDQVKQLFDPLLEYSPEDLTIQYLPSENDIHYPSVKSSHIDSVTKELLDVQTNFTLNLVQLLQEFVIPLRIQVLESQSSNGISRLNKIFPPTIDEITRVNCILHDALSRASQYGFIEVLKVFSLILPYFYRAFIRHEANMKFFGPRLKKFHAKNEKGIFLNNNINKGAYTLHRIDSIVSGSRLELPKLGLILKRLYDTVENEMISHMNFESFSNNERDYVRELYATSMKVVDAFGYEEHSEDEAAQRVFTPSGKILVEIADNWPSQFQIGWLSRKIAAIFELRNIKPFDTRFNIDVLVVFTDKVLLLTVTDESYYEAMKNDTGRILVSDILMNSLINEKPLPSLTLVPLMTVSCWAEIGDVIPSFYSGGSESTHDYVRFLSTASSGFKGNLSKPCFSLNYQMIQGDNRCSGRRITETINKSKILSRKRAFHLFKQSMQNFDIFSTAFESSEYQKEQLKSPFLLVLNSSLSHEIYFKNNPALYLLINASMKDDMVEVKVSRRDGSLNTEEKVKVERFLKYLKDMLMNSFREMFVSFNGITQSLIHSYEQDVDYYKDVFVNDKVVYMKTPTQTDVDEEIFANETPGQQEKVNEKHSTTTYTPFNSQKGADLYHQEETRPKKKFLSRILSKFRSKDKQNGNKVNTLDDNVKQSKPKKRLSISSYLSIPGIQKLTSNSVLSNEGTVRNFSGQSSLLTPASIYSDETNNASAVIPSEKQHIPGDSIDVNSQFAFPAKVGDLNDTENYGVSSKLNTQKESKGGRSRGNSIKILDPSIKMTDSQAIPTYEPELFYKDGEKNWVKISKDLSVVENLADMKEEKETVPEEQKQPSEPSKSGQPEKQLRTLSTTSIRSMDINTFERLIDQNFSSTRDIQLLGKDDKNIGRYVNADLAQSSATLNEEARDKERPDMMNSKGRVVSETLDYGSSISSEATIIEDFQYRKPDNGIGSSPGNNLAGKSSHAMTPSYNSINVISDLISGRMEIA